MVVEQTPAFGSTSPHFGGGRVIAGKKRGH
jgi:hypothetical protein